MELDEIRKTSEELEELLKGYKKKSNVQPPTEKTDLENSGRNGRVGYWDEEPDAPAGSWKAPGPETEDGGRVGWSGSEDGGQESWSEPEDADRGHWQEADGTDQGSWPGSEDGGQGGWPDSEDSGRVGWSGSKDGGQESWSEPEDADQGHWQEADGTDPGGWSRPEDGDQESWSGPEDTDQGYHWQEADGTDQGGWPDSEDSGRGGWSEPEDSGQGGWSEPEDNGQGGWSGSENADQGHWQEAEDEFWPEDNGAPVFSEKARPISRSKQANRERKKNPDHSDDNFFCPTGRMGLWAAFCVPVVVMIVIFVQRGIFPFGERSFLRTDMYHQYAPFFSEFQYKLTHGGSLLYSWDVGMGVNFSALYAYYLASPLNWLLVLCPKSMIIEFMTYMIVLKIGLSGLSFAWYLRKHCGRDDFGVAFFGIFYALSGYMAAYSWNIMWLDCILLFPLVMLGAERLVKERKGMLYCVTLGICILSNYYISIMICIFMVLYFFGLLVLEHHPGKKAGDYVVNCLQFGACSLLAGGLAAAVLLPEIYALQMTASGDFNFPQTASSYFSIFDMFARHIGNVEVEIGLDHWPNIYCGVAVIMFFFLYLCCRKIPVRHKAVYCSFLLLFYASFSINVLNFIWHGFHYPNSLPCRQSFIYIFLMLYICYEAYTHLREMELRQTGGAFLGAVVFVILAEKLVEQKHFEFYMYYVAILFLAVYAGLVWVYKRNPRDYGLVVILALAVVSVESAVNTTVTSVTTINRTTYILDNEDVRSLVSTIPNDEGFYRVEKVDRKTKNDGAWMNFPSVSLFSSTANADLTAFFKSVGCEGSVNAYSITGSTPLIDSLFALKYGLYSQEQNQDDMLQFMGQSGETWLYERYFTMPLGFMLPEEFDDSWDRAKDNPAQVQNGFAELMGADRVLLEASGEASGDGFRFTPSIAGNYYVYVPNRKVEEVEVDKGTEKLSFSNVNRGFLLELGWCDARQTVTVKNKDEDGASVYANAYRFSEDGLKSVYNKLMRYPFEVTGWTDTTVEGVVHTEKPGVLFTSIPYDKGWTVTVDGQAQETEKIFDAFLSVRIPEGTHTVSMSYMPQGLELGAAVSGGSILILLIAGLIGRGRRRKKAKAAGEAKRQAG